MRFQLDINYDAVFYHPELVYRENSPIYLECADKVYKVTGVYVSTVMLQSKALFSHDWGCPYTGKDSLTFTGSLNPLHHADVKVWRASVVDVAELLKHKLIQTVAYLSFFESELIYLKD